MTTNNPYRLPRTVVPSAYRIFLTPDLEAFTFDGRVEIDVEINESLDSFTLNAAELELGPATVTAGSSSWQSIGCETEEKYETATYRFDSALPAGAATIEIAFTGILNDQLHGFYRSTYTDDAGVAHTIATTQFESSDARKAFPCWDEPAFKATYQVNLTVPSHLSAFSNSAAISDTDLGNGLRALSFAPTMKMSTYLVAFVVGPFEATEPIDVDGVPVRVIYPIGKGRLTAYALEVAAHALRFFTEYFDIPYPGDKYDLVAIPDFAAGAMENLGLVTFRETELLIDPERASFNQFERVALVINHETAHMWFGDLVTMDWWEGIWLNEAFATFMESICTDAFRPQWQKWVGFTAQKEVAFAVDSLHSTRPIEYEVVSPDDCRGMFDALTYLKGCSVLRMIEQYLGAETFRDGIRHYLRKHAYANTVTSDLWAALEEASGQPVGQIMDTWILQGGYPLLSVRDGKLTQEPFTFGPTDGPSAIGSNWQIPVLTREIGQQSTTAQIVGPNGASVSIGGTAVVNAGGSGFYRVAYGTTELAAISKELTHLTEIERAGLFSDTWAAAMVGRAGATDVLRLAAGMGELDEPSVWGVVQQSVLTLNRLVDDEGREILSALVRKLTRPQFERLGWTAKPGEAERTGQLRALILDLLGVVGKDPEVIVEALRRFDANEVIGDVANPIVAITAHQARAGDEATFAERQSAAPNPQEEQLYLFGGSATTDEAWALRLFDRCFSDVRTQDAPFLIGALIRNRLVGKKVWRKYAERWDEAVERFPIGTPVAGVGGVATLIDDPAFASEVRAFHTAHPLAAGQRQIEQSLERMDILVNFGQRVRPTLNEELRQLLG